MASQTNNRLLISSLGICLSFSLGTMVEAKPDLTRIRGLFQSRQNAFQPDPNLPPIRPLNNSAPLNPPGAEYDFYSLPAQRIEAQHFEGDDPNFESLSTSGMTRIDTYHQENLQQNAPIQSNNPWPQESRVFSGTQPSNSGYNSGFDQGVGPAAPNPTLSNGARSATVIPSAGQGHIVAQPRQLKFDQVFNTRPETSQDYLQRGIMRYTYQDYTGSISDLDQALILDPEEGKAYFYRGSAYKQLKNNRAAEKDLEKALNLNHQSDDFYLKDGIAREQSQDLTGAIDQYSQALKLNSENLQAYFARANAKLKSAQYASALTDYNQLLTIDPINAEALRQRAFTKYKLGRLSEAMADYEVSKNLFFEQKNLIGYQSTVRSINLLRNSFRR